MIKNIICVLILGMSFSVSSQENGFGCIEKIKIESSIYEEDREIWVGLPVNYDTNKTYPVLYVLDAETRFDITYALSKELFVNHSKASELIVVGIPHIDWSHRIMDMTFTSSLLDSRGIEEPTMAFSEEKTGGGDDFLWHLEEEVIPTVEDNYNSNGFNTLCGHSLGGYYCAYVMAMESSFSAFQIHDGSIWYNSGDVLNHLRKNLDKNIKTNVYVTTGLAFIGPSEYVDGHFAMIDTLRSVLKEYPNINMGSKLYPEEDHVSMYMYSVIDGLTYLFKDCDYGFISPFEELTLAEYFEFYEKVSERMGFKFEPPLDGVRWVGYSNHYQENWEEALKSYHLCYHLYKEDIAVHKEMLDCYTHTNNVEKQKKFEERVKQLEEAAK